MNSVLAIRPQWLILTICATPLFVGSTLGQTYYKWTDANGIVHFSDQQPAPGKNKIEERDLIPPPQAPSEPAIGGAVDRVPAASETPGGSASGPARIVMVEHDAPHTSPSTVHVSGKVKNVGGEAADGVAVSISAIDVNQGNPCLQAEADVSPSSLGPGETGSFDSNIDSPCLLGGSQVDISPTWQR